MTKRQRKTKDEWHVEVNYGNGWELECVEESRKDAVEQRRCYHQNCQYPVRICKRRIRLGWSIVGCRFALPHYTRASDDFVGYVPVMRLVAKKDGNDDHREHRLVGTVGLLCRSYFPEQEPLALLVLLDRLQECPEEVKGAESELVLKAVEWCRSQL